MAPEQINGNVSFQSDIYSYGCLLYTLYLYEKPWGDLNYMQIIVKFSNEETPVVENESIPENLKVIIERCLNFSQFLRPTSEELYGILKKAYETKFDELFYSLHKVLGS